MTSHVTGTHRACHSVEWSGPLVDQLFATQRQGDAAARTITLRFGRRAWAATSACYAQGISQPSGSSVQTVMEVIARKGDIKTRLEAEVCCAYKGGNHNFATNGNSNQKVHVRLSYRSWGDNRCNRTETLSSDDKIDCQSFRQTYCAHQNLWD